MNKVYWSGHDGIWDWPDPLVAHIFYVPKKWWSLKEWKRCRRMMKEIVWDEAAPQPEEGK